MFFIFIFRIDKVFVFVQVYISIERMKYVLGKASNTRYQSAIITSYVFPWTLVFPKLGKVSSYVRQFSIEGLLVKTSKNY